MWLTDSDDPTDPTNYIEPRQHPDNPDHTGPIEPRHFEVVVSAPVYPSGAYNSHSEEYQIDSTGIYVGAYPYGIYKYDLDWNYVGRIANAGLLT